MPVGSKLGVDVPLVEFLFVDQVQGISAFPWNRCRILGPPHINGPEPVLLRSTPGQVVAEVPLVGGPRHDLPHFQYHVIFLPVEIYFDQQPEDGSVIGHLALPGFGIPTTFPIFPPVLEGAVPVVECPLMGDTELRLQLIQDRVGRYGGHIEILEYIHGSCGYVRNIPPVLHQIEIGIAAHEDGLQCELVFIIHLERCVLFGNLVNVFKDVITLVDEPVMNLPGGIFVVRPNVMLEHVHDVTIFLRAGTRFHQVSSEFAQHEPLFYHFPEGVV